ncbi:ABC-type multidrug transport system ATPase subunit [Lewinella marina]|uniref:ABC transporter ATP-binding protein n=1 Tax=Neolewinella marina TaxID=438751 RepID=A0A2G0CFD2_9BACT|nr:ATP-binding cassette domain-containing protein [Neolewinella marina]NJB85631.1 ABC-type multidrug transport system ATPase subunit [Neolewinella marina]PHK98684.1 ABC transporter ATP-binding protein [Neolewinella marina]
MAADLPSLKIDVKEVSKRFGRTWIIRQLSAEYTSGTIYGIRGRNGSGKSTLIRMLAGQLSPSRGSLRYTLGDHELPVEDLYAYVSWTGPYFELVEELTVREFLSFHFAMKPLLPGLTVDGVVERIGLQHAARYSLTDCSSGMRQRVLLASALYAATPLLLLDEPTVTLDASSAEWFLEELHACATGRLTFIASNDERDLSACDTISSL